MRSARGTVPETEIDPRRDLHGAQSRIGGTCEDANRAGQGKRSQGPERKPAPGLRLVGMKIESGAVDRMAFSIVPISNFQCSKKSPCRPTEENRKWSSGPHWYFRLFQSQMFQCSKKSPCRAFFGGGGGN